MLRNPIHRSLFLALWIIIGIRPSFAEGRPPGNRTPQEKAAAYFEKFNLSDDECYIQDIPNSRAAAFLLGNIPYFECPDEQMEETYYFRWWTYRKHVKQTPAGYVVSEFLPDVSWAGAYNTISCAAAHHFYEGRWLHNPVVLQQYARFWFNEGNPRLYSFWVADAVLRLYEIHPDTGFLAEVYPHLKANFEAWIKEKRETDGLFWQVDDRDGMEMSLSGRLGEGGKGYRPTINSYMYGESLALSRIAGLIGNKQEETFYKEEADRIREIIHQRLWDEQDQFYKVIPYGRDGSFSPVRELHGYTPWYFNIPLPEHAVAWLELINPQGFYAPYGLTTAEQRSPGFIISYEGHECQWNGPSWPYSTSVTLTALANLLEKEDQSYVTRKDYYHLLRQYAGAHQLEKEDGTLVPWIDENLNPFTGDWISRTRLKQWRNGTWDEGKGGYERGKDYNHSTFCDLVISGLVGIRPAPENTLIIDPLIPVDEWSYFCLDQVKYKNHMITILYDKDGTKYQKGKGLMIFIDDKLRSHTPGIERVSCAL